MIDPFFSFFEDEKQSISQHLFGKEKDTYKKYPDLPITKLEMPMALGELEENIANRTSAVTFTNQSIELESLSRVLKFSGGLNGQSESFKRVYPSGGALYPIEIYVAAIRVNGLSTSLYHYNVEQHGLVELKKISRESIDDCFPAFSSNMSIFTAPVVVFMTFNRGRSTQKYNNLAYKHGLIEVGHIGQNIYLNAQKNKLKARAHSGGKTEKIHNLLDIDGIGEHILYITTLGIGA